MLTSCAQAHIPGMAEERKTTNGDDVFLSETEFVPFLVVCFNAWACVSPV
jgi:hypothetical protein